MEQANEEAIRQITNTILGSALNLKQKESVFDTVWRKIKAAPSRAWNYMKELMTKKSVIVSALAVAGTAAIMYTKANQKKREDVVKTDLASECIVDYYDSVEDEKNRKKKEIDEKKIFLQKNLTEKSIQVLQQMEEKGIPIDKKLFAANVGTRMMQDWIGGTDPKFDEIIKNRDEALNNQMKDIIMESDLANPDQYESIKNQKTGNVEFFMKDPDVNPNSETGIKYLIGRGNYNDDDVDVL